MKRTTTYAAHGIKINAVPSGLAGDWVVNGAYRYRFNNDGVYSVVTVMPYTIVGDKELRFPTETYSRISGTTGLTGIWRQLFSTGERLDLTFGPYSFYSFEWDDGFRGGGYFSNDGTNVTLVETKRHFTITGNTIAFIDLDSGAVENSSYAIVGDTLSIGATTYTRIPF